MNSRSHVTIIAWFLIVLALTLVLSSVRGRIMAAPDESLPAPRELVIRDGMTAGQFGEANALARPLLREVLGLRDASQLATPLSEFGLSFDELSARVSRARALESESASKDWVRIRIKFALWIAWLVLVFVLLRRGVVVRRMRIALYVASVLLFGVILGSDPSPMGTVKDAVALYGAFGAVFRPRMIAMVIFLLMVLVANKFICAWGCQFGTLQDLIFRLRIRRQGPHVAWKPPFALTNTIRALFFVAMTVVAFSWAFDIVDPIDPFKIFKPHALSLIGAAFLAVLLVGSLFTYRPWCHFLCPFGLVGWIVEKVSVFRVKVDRGACIDCKACVRACPSSVMGAILERDRVVPDCFACGTCIEECPVDAIHFAAGRRDTPREE